MKRLAFFASHNGSAARAITSACLSGEMDAKPVLLISNNEGSKALEWARDLGLKSAVINAGTSQDTDETIAAMLQDNKIDLAVCSGYMKLIGPKTLGVVNAILNVHPALLPKHGGKGMYGRHVHQAVHDANDTETGITIHLIDGEYDHGKTVAQKILPIPDSASVDEIETMVRTAEPEFYKDTLKKILRGEISI